MAPSLQRATRGRAPRAGGSGASAATCSSTRYPPRLPSLVPSLGSLAQVVVPLVERQIVDNVIVRHNSPLTPWLVASLALGAVTFAGAYFRRYRGARVARDVQGATCATPRSPPAGARLCLPRPDADRPASSGRANLDSMLVQGLLVFLPIMSGNILMLILSLAVMVYLSPLLALVSILVAPAALHLVQDGVAGLPATWDGQQREGDRRLDR